MRRTFAQLQGIDLGHRITKETDHEFWCCLQDALLLALVELGRLNNVQYRAAKKRLEQEALGKDEA